MDKDLMNNEHAIAVGESGGQMESKAQEKDEKKAVAKIVAGDKNESNSEIAEKTGDEKVKIIEKSHKKKITVTESGVASAAQSSYPCDICGKILKERRSLKNHLLIHTKESKRCETEEGLLNERIKSMMAKSTVHLPNLGLARICKICGKEGAWGDVRKHIEARHITGVTHTCNFCWKNYKSFSSLASHKSQTHKGEK